MLDDNKVTEKLRDKSETTAESKQVNLAALSGKTLSPQPAPSPPPVTSSPGPLPPVYVLK